MSRVFDALKRAGEEKKQTVETSGLSNWVSAENTPDRTVEKSETQTAVSMKEISSSESLGFNGDLRSGFLTRPVPDPKPRSWRERLDNLVFGWGISRFASHPIVALEKESPVAEQCKILREQIKKLRAETGARCIAVTSPVKRDGKTTVAVNLAAAMALDYEGKILLIDCDLRRPEIHRYFGIDPSPGLGDYLSSSGNGNFLSCIRDTFIPGFQIIPGGKPSDLSSELLAKEKMKILMEEIRASFPEHQIILDAPPVLSTPDPLVLGRHVDGIVVVVRAGKTPRDYLAKAVHSLNSTKVMGIVLNGVDLGTDSKYYRYSTKSH